MPLTMNAINAILRPAGLVINGTTLREAPSIDDILAAVGNPPHRDNVLLDQGRPWRKFVILDQLGVYLLYDFEIERVIDVHFCFAASKSPASPSVIFSGVLMVNGVRLVAGTAEDLLPTCGEFKFRKEGGWVATGETIFVHMQLARKRLRAVGVTFRKRPQFSSEAT